MAVDNHELAELLRSIADTLRETGANRYRISAYDRAADAVDDAQESLASLYQASGKEGLERVRGVGEGIANVIMEYLDTGRSRLLDDLRAKVDPVELFTDVPGIGPELARRIGDELGVSSLEELERAAHDGRLESVDGVGAHRARAVRDHLAARLAPQPETRRAGDDRDEGQAPPEKLLLEIDREYREMAEKGKLRTIAPRRFNPGGERWLPVMETERNGWSFSALYSNTARAHEKGKTRDWVVIYWEKDGRKGQNTVVTAERGSGAGERVVAH